MFAEVPFGFAHTSSLHIFREKYCLIVRFLRLLKEVEVRCFVGMLRSFQKSCFYNTKNCEKIK